VFISEINRSRGDGRAPRLCVIGASRNAVPGGSVLQHTVLQAEVVRDEHEMQHQRQLPTQKQDGREQSGESFSWQGHAGVPGLPAIMAEGCDLRNPSCPQGV
jgi:hypothetical protein